MIISRNFEKSKIFKKLSEIVLTKIIYRCILISELRKTTQEETKMTKTYNIYNMQTDELIGQIEATNVISAEIKASEKYDIESEQLYALTA